MLINLQNIEYKATDERNVQHGNTAPSRIIATNEQNKIWKNVFIASPHDISYNILTKI